MTSREPIKIKLWRPEKNDAMRPSGKDHQLSARKRRKKCM